jgi:hypothetical protein
MDRDTSYRTPLYELDLTGLADLCTNVARNASADHRQSDAAHALRVEWVRLSINGTLDGARTEAENSLTKRMAEFLAGVPQWMREGP